jgi:uncharacterized protein YbcI
MATEQPIDTQAEDENLSGDVRSRISTNIVQLHKEYYGRGPTKTKTYYQEDFVLILLRGGFTTVERTLLHAGRREAVTAQRHTFQEVMRPLYAELIERETRWAVTAFMSTTHQDPDILAELFILEPVEGMEVLGG